METRPFLVAGRPCSGTDAFDVLYPWDDSVVARIARPGPADVEAALAAAHAARGAMRRVPPGRRAEILAAVAARLGGEADAWAATIVRESGKPRGAARAEVEHFK